MRKTSISNIEAVQGIRLCDDDVTKLSPLAWLARVLARIADIPQGPPARTEGLFIARSGARMHAFCVRSGSAAPYRQYGLVDQTISEHRAAEGAADETCHHRLSQCRALRSPNQMCERVWTLPTWGLVVREEFLSH